MMALDITMLTSFKFYLHVSSRTTDKQLTSLDSRVEIVKTMVRANHEHQRQVLSGPIASAPTQARFDGLDYSLVFTIQRRVFTTIPTQD